MEARKSEPWKLVTRASDWHAKLQAQILHMLDDCVSEEDHDGLTFYVMDRSLTSSNLLGELMRMYAAAPQPPAEPEEPVCPACHGSGEQEHQTYDRGPYDYSVTGLCGSCGGAGEIRPMAARSPDVDDLRDRLVAISGLVAEQNDRMAQAMIRDALAMLAAANAQEPADERLKQ